MIDDQCDDGRTPCDPPRPREAGCWWSDAGYPDWMARVFLLDYDTVPEHWQRITSADRRSGPTCTASEAT